MIRRTFLGALSALLSAPFGLLTRKDDQTYWPPVMPTWLRGPTQLWLATVATKTPEENFDPLVDMIFSMVHPDGMIYSSGIPSITSDLSPAYPRGVWVYDEYRKVWAPIRAKATLHLNDSRETEIPIFIDPRQFRPDNIGRKSVMVWPDREGTIIRFKLSQDLKAVR